MQLLQSNLAGTNPQLIDVENYDDQQWLDYALKCSRDGDGHLIVVGTSLDKENVTQRVINAVAIAGVMVLQNLIQDYVPA